MITGRMRFVVLVQRQGVAKNGMGERVGPWTTLLETRASIEPIRGAERIQAGAEHADLTTRIRMRWHPDIADMHAGDRVLHGTQVFDIKAAINAGNSDKWFVLECISHV